ncbi:MAG TPA: hypothetical protein VFQ40_07555 [Actinomycetota bacterium]|nr:hypothetical protein [Actinomycetota bacterium]
MSKRSAVFVAAILVSLMGLGALATSLGLAGPSPASAGVDRARPERVVQVQRRTITVHRPAAPQPAAAPATTIVVPSSSGSDDGSEHEDEFEVEDELEHEAEHEDEFEVEDD